LLLYERSGSDEAIEQGVDRILSGPGGGADLGSTMLNLVGRRDLEYVDGDLALALFAAKADELELADSDGPDACRRARDELAGMVRVLETMADGDLTMRKVKR
jgi:hypothetical protein